MFELMAAAKLLLTAPGSILGTERAKIEAKFGTPQGVGTDFMAAPAADGTKDRVITMDWPQLRIRLYESGATHSVQLLGVTTTADLLKIDSPVHIGVDRSTVLRELGGAVYEDADQIVYSLKEEDASLPNQTVRLVFRDDRVVGIDWSYPIGE
jgi:hypothetical protein